MRVVFFDLGACPTLTVLLWRMICTHLRRSRPEKILNVFQRIRLRFLRACGLASGPHLLRLVTKAMSDRLLLLRSLIFHERSAASADPRGLVLLSSLTQPEALTPFGMEKSTPLWLYILKKAEIMENGLRLGPVGGRIVGEVFLRKDSLTRSR
jgi:hypothetical protein